MHLCGGQGKRFFRETSYQCYATGLMNRSITRPKCVAWVFAAVMSGLPAPAWGQISDATPHAAQLSTWLIFSILAGIVVFGAMTGMAFLRARDRGIAQIAMLEEQMDGLRREAGTAQSVLAAEPQVLLQIDDGGAAHLLCNNLQTKKPIPQDADALLQFDQWLKGFDVSRLQAGFEQLRGHGTPFNMMVHTLEDEPLEADGRAVGGRVILKFRDIAGDRSEHAALMKERDQLGLQMWKMRALLDALPYPAWFRDEFGALTWVSNAYVQSVDAQDAGEVLDRQTELLEKRQIETVNEALTKGGTFDDRLHTVVNGERRAFNLIAVPHGERSAYIAIDVAEVESAQNSLDKHLEAFDRILDRVSTAVAIFGADQHLNYFNQAYLDLWHFESAWLTERPTNGEILDQLRVARRLPEQRDYKAWKRHQLEIYTVTEPREDWWHLPDGQTIEVTAQQGPDGSVTYIYENMTERFNLESRYNAFINVQRESLDALREGVAVFATNGRLRLFNPAFSTIWDLNPRMLEGEPHIDEVISECRTLYDDEDSWARLQAAVTAIDDKRRSFNRKIRRPDGMVIAYGGVPLPDGATMLTFNDITDAERAEQALIERAEALEAADKLKNAFISHVSYELRTPLTNIIGFAELMGDSAFGTLNDRQREYLSDIRMSGESLRAIINDILDLAMFDAGALELQPVPVKAEKLIDDAALAVREALKAADVELSVSVRPGDEPFVADGRRVTQVLYNLLTNAIGFSEAGDTVSLRCARDGEFMAFSVEDQGCGIPQDIQESVFNRFESYPQGSEHRGAGLGLSIVKSLVELHGGDVQLRSKKDLGTRVTVRFPITPQGPVDGPGEGGRKSPRSEAQTNAEDESARV